MRRWWLLTTTLIAPQSLLWKAFDSNPRAAVMYIIDWGLCHATMEGLSVFQDSQRRSNVCITPSVLRGPDRLEMDSTARACQTQESTGGNLWNILGRWVHWLMIRGTNRSCVNRHVRYAAVRVSEKKRTSRPITEACECVLCGLSGPNVVCDREHLT